MRGRLALAFAALLAGCGHTELHEVVLRAPSGPSGHEPELYQEGAAPARPYYDVALLQAIGYADDAEPDDVTRAIVSRAVELGCDAVVRFRVEQGATRANAFGVCVRYAQPSPSVPPAPAVPTAAPPAPEEETL